MKNFILFVILLSLFSVISKAEELVIGAMNVENLFDTRHDKGKQDWDNTPLGTPGKEKNCKKKKNKYYKKKCLALDWTKKVLERKLESIAESLKLSQYGIPDVLALSEVENDNVLNMLSQKLDYKTYFISNSPDKRGIDVAILVKNPRILNYKGVEQLQATSMDVYFKKKPTRNILKVRFQIKGEELLIYSNHWPSQGNPNHTRMKVAQAFKKDVERELKKNPKVNIISLGDFNVISKNDPNPLITVLIKEMGLIDLSESYNKKEGTYFYKRNKEWNFLDKIFISKTLDDSKGIDVVKNSFHIEVNKLNSTQFSYKKGKKIFDIIIPKRFDPNEKDLDSRGVSDHFPVMMKLKY